MKKAALYDPYLDTLGGGEKHILSILKVLEEEGYEISIYWDNNLETEIENRFRIKFGRRVKFLPNVFATHNALQKLKDLRKVDIFFYVTDGSYFFSSAKKNFVFCMVPNKTLYNMSVLNKLKTSNFRFIVNSLYTQNWLKKWGVRSRVIYPYINQDFLLMPIGNFNKEKIILSIGRFYSHLHSKKQSVLIDLFNKLNQSNQLYKDFKLIIAGGLKNEDKSYLDQLYLKTKKNPNIIFKTNVSYSDLLNLYKKSLLYLHMTGYGNDEVKHPEQSEHLGIAPLEAMSSGCITFCYNSGGPKEIIKDGENGFLFDNVEELTKKMSFVLSNPELQIKIKNKAKKYIRNNFSYEKFKNKVKQILL